MSISAKRKAELLNELKELREEYNSLKELYERDVTELRQAEEKTRRSEEKLWIAYMTSPDSINVNRLSDGMYMSVNEGFTRITGYAQKEVIGKTSLELNIWNDPEDRKRLIRELKEKGKVQEFEAVFRKKNGSTVTGLMSATVIDIDGVPHILNTTKDISRRKNVEEALAREQFLVDALMNNLTDHIYFKDLESRFIRMNKAQATRFGLDDPAQAVGKTDFDFFTKEHAQQAFDDEQEIIRTGQTLTKEEKETHADKPDSWVSTVKMPLLDKDGNIIGTFGNSRDITDQKKSEERLFLIANALKSINECVSITDMNDNILFLNQAFVETYGYNEEDLKHEPISLIRSESNSPELLNQILPATLSGGWYGELINRKKDGTEFLVSLSTALVRNNQGQPAAMIGVANDITVRKRTELENQINYEIAQGITTTSNLDELMRLIHHSLGKVVYAENCFVALYDQITGTFSFPYFVDKLDSVPPPSSLPKSCTSYVFRTVKPLLLTQEKFDILAEQGEVELIGTNSSSWLGIPLQTPSRVIGVLVLQHYEKENVYSENDTKFLLSIGTQIALAIERKKAEEEITLKNKQLQALNAEKDKFFSIIAHDLRGPLSAFVAATQILTEEIQTMNINEIKEITLSMKASALNIYSLLENLLEWSRLKRGGLNIVKEKLNLEKNVRTCVDVLMESAKKKEIEISISIPEEIEVSADKHMLETVIRNLVSNAIKFTHIGGKVSITADYRSDHSIEVKVIDTGIGMTPELKNKLFLINEKTNRSGTEGELSTGIGLLLCKEFIEQCGGKIWVTSEAGKGSVFTFTLMQFPE